MPPAPTRAPVFPITWGAGWSRVEGELVVELGFERNTLKCGDSINLTRPRFTA